MKQYYKSLLFSCLLVFVAACGIGNSNNSETPASRPVVEQRNYKATSQTVLMISIDGFRTDYLEKYSPPVLTKLATGGVRAKGMRPSFPSLTFPNHVTLVTGLAPGNNGITSNFFFDKKRNEAYAMNDGNAVNDGSWYRGDPLWAAVERAGYHAYVYFWVGSEADIGGVKPTFVKHYDESITNQERGDDVIGFLNKTGADKPALVNLYFSSVDSAGHKYGPDSNEVRASILEVDAVIGKIVAEVEQKKLPVQIVIVSDHGMLNVKEQINLSTKADLSNFNSYERGATTTLVSKNPSISAIDQAYNKLKTNQKNYKVYRAGETPANWKYNDVDRGGDILVVAEPGYYMYKDEGFTTEPPRVSKATHGWDPKTVEMQALFIAYGSAFKKGLVIPVFDNVHVYPMMLELLKVTSPTPNDGDPEVLSGILK